MDGLVDKTTMDTLVLFAEQLQTRIAHIGLQSRVEANTTTLQFTARVTNTGESVVGEGTGWNPYTALTSAYNDYRAKQ